VRTPFADQYRRPRRLCKGFPLRCRACGAASHRKARQKAFREAVKAWRQAKKEYKPLQSLRRQALKGLAKKEVNVVRELGL